MFLSSPNFTYVIYIQTESAKNVLHKKGLEVIIKTTIKTKLSTSQDTHY